MTTKSYNNAQHKTMHHKEQNVIYYGSCKLTVMYGQDNKLEYYVCRPTLTHKSTH